MTGVNVSVRARFRRARTKLALTAGLLRPSNRTFAAYVIKDHLRFFDTSVRPIEGETVERAKAAAGWLTRAQDATPDDGVSFGYFPCDAREGHGWRPSYPETTGYIIPTLLDYAQRFKEPEVQRRAIAMARWETRVQMASGAVQSGPICPPEKQVPAAFNTGMVLHGYTAAYRVSHDDDFLKAGRRAADFLVADLGEDGHLRTHGPAVTQHRIKTYNCLCGWALYRFGEDTGEDHYRRAAVRTIEAALGQQQANGWFLNNCLSDPSAPLSHTIGYTLQGILEVGTLSRRADFISAVRRGTDPLLDRLSPRGFLHARFNADWTPAVRSSCLTGSAQIAVVCYRLYENTGETRYRRAANRIVNYLKALQVVDSVNPAMNGAIPGSFPLLGAYMPGGYPNWATKFFLDALLCQDRFQEL